MDTPDATFIPTVRKMVSLVDRRTVLRLEGPGSLDFLNRMSTNELSALAVGEFCTTVFTNEKGKIVELADVYRSGDHILLIGAKGDGTKLAQWLERFIIMEDISIKNLSQNVLCIDAFPKGGEEPPPAQQGMLLTYSPELWRGHLQRSLIETGARPEAIHAPEVDRKSSASSEGRGGAFPPASEIMLARLHLGIPAEEELTSEYNPLEAGLERFLSFTKGCYIGQEVIARIDSYKKLQRKLFRINIKNFDTTQRHQPVKILCGEAECGRIMSNAIDPETGNWVGLAYIELKYSKNEITMFCACGNSHLLEVIF